MAGWLRWGAVLWFPDCSTKCGLAWWFTRSSEHAFDFCTLLAALRHMPVRRAAVGVTVVALCWFYGGGVAVRRKTFMIN